jgi:hypothetical protein
MGPIAARLNCAHWDIEEASLSIRGSKVTSDMKTQLTSQMHDDDIRTFSTMKETWYPQTFNSIDWYASELALGCLSKNHQKNVVKIYHNYWYTGSHHHTFYGGDRPCCLFQETKEDWRHILSCLSPVPGCGLPPSFIMAESQKGHASVASPCRLLDSNIKRNPAPLTRHTRINQPVFNIPNSTQPNQE